MGSAPTDPGYLPRSAHALVIGLGFVATRPATWARTAVSVSMSSVSSWGL
jgi:hypothetical protein